MDTISQFVQWLTTLDLKKLLLVLVVGIMGGMGYIIYHQDEKITTLTAEKSKMSERCDSINTVAAKLVQDCQNERINDANKITEVWRQKFEELERRTTEGYQNMQEIRNNNR